MPTAKKRFKSNKEKKENNAFFIAGIGASDGGLDAVGLFFNAMPDEFPVKE